MVFCIFTNICNYHPSNFRTSLSPQREILYHLATISLSPISSTLNEYLIFQKIIKLEYDVPEKFFPKARDLVEKLLVNVLHFLLVSSSSSHPLSPSRLVVRGAFLGGTVFNKGRLRVGNGCR